MERVAFVFGLLLIAVGVTSYYQPAVFGESGAISKTALIPAWIGVALFVCGWLTMGFPGIRKHAMHFAAVVGLLGTVGGFMPMNRSGFNFSKASAVSGALLSGICFLFVILCVRSFIAAGKARRAAL